VYCQNHSSSPESFAVCLSISSGGNLLYIPLERETLFRVSLDRPEHIDFSIAQQEESGDMLAILLGLFRLIWLFGRSQDAVALENLTLRQQLAIYKRKKKRPRLIRRDR
jgi:hypothetical protein